MLRGDWEEEDSYTYILHYIIIHYYTNENKVMKRGKSINNTEKSN